jgi:hypothetical protein
MYTKGFFGLFSLTVVLGLSMVAVGCTKSSRNYYQVQNTGSSSALTGLVIKNQATGQDIGSTYQIGTSTSAAFIVEGVKSDNSRVILSSSEFTFIQGATTSGIMNPNFTFASTATPGSTDVTVRSVQFPSLTKKFTILVGQGSSTAVLTGLVIKNQANGQEAVSPFAVGTSTTTTFVVEGIYSDASQTQLTSSDVTVSQSNTTSGVFGADLVFSANTIAGDTDVTITSVASPGVALTLTISVSASAPAPPTLVSLIVKNQANGQEVVSPFQVGTNTNTTFSVVGVYSDSSQTVFASSSVTVSQTTTTSGVLNANLVFSANTTVGSTDVTIASAQTPNVSKSFTITVAASTYTIILDPPTRTVFVGNSSNIPISVSQNGTTHVLNSSQYSLSLGNPVVGSISGPIFTASQTAGVSDLTVNVINFNGVAKSETFTAAITVDDGSQPGQLVQSLVISVPAGALPGPGQSFLMNMTGTVVGGAPLTDRKLVLWDVVEGQALVDREGNVTCARSGEQIKVRARARGPLVTANNRNYNSVTSAEITFTSGTGNLDTLQVMPDKTDGFVAAGIERKLYAIQNSVDVSLDAALVASIVTGTNAVALRREGNTWLLKGLNEGDWDVQLSFGGRTHMIKSRTVIGSPHCMREAVGGNEIWDVVMPLSGCDYNAQSGRVRLAILARATNEEYVSTTTPAFFGPGHHTGSSAYLPGYGNVDPLPGAIEDVVGVKTLANLAGNGHFHFAHEFTPAVGATSYVMPTYHTLGHYVSPTTNPGDPAWAYVINPARSNWFYVKNVGQEENFSLRLTFDPLPADAFTNRDAMEAWLDSIQVTREEY